MLQREITQTGLLKVTGDAEDMETLKKWIDGDSIRPSLNKDFLEELDREGWKLVDLFEDEAYFEKPAGN